MNFKFYLILTEIATYYRAPCPGVSGTASLSLKPFPRAKRVDKSTLWVDSKGANPGCTEYSSQGDSFKPQWLLGSLAGAATWTWGLKSMGN